MKLHRELLETFIDLSGRSDAAVRALLEEQVSDVKGVTVTPQGTVFTVEGLANRGDLLCALGCARELSARELLPISFPPLAAELPKKRPSLPVQVATRKCLRYSLAEAAVPVGMSLAPLVKRVLFAEREIDAERHPLVHLLNFVALELGQPMHAFDRDKVDGEVIVDELSEAKSFSALDGNVYTVPVGSMVIRDRSSILAVAGVIGGASSMVTPGTTRVLLESATFDPASVRKTARAMGIATDASFLFERGTDPDLPLTALRRVVALSDAGGGGLASSGGIQIQGVTTIETELPPSAPMLLSLKAVKREVNLPRLADTEIIARLKYLGFSIEATGREGEVRVLRPSWRWRDIATTQDLVEEVARAIGLHRIKAELPPLAYEDPTPSRIALLRERLDPLLTARGLSEVVTKVFTGERVVTLLDSFAPGLGASHVRVNNSIEGAYTHLKSTNLVHLGEILEDGLRRGVVAPKVYEFGRYFVRPNQPLTSVPVEGGEFERDVLSLALAGRLIASEWRRPEGMEMRWQHLLGLVRDVLHVLGVSGEVRGGDAPLLHPARQFTVVHRGVELARGGEIHPRLARELGWENKEFLFAEFELGPLGERQQPIRYLSPSDYPAIRRDLTVDIDPHRSAAEVIRIFRREGGEALSDVAFVDVFQKEEGQKKRSTFRLTFLRSDRTLQADEVDGVMKHLIATAAEQGFPLSV